MAHLIESMAFRGVAPWHIGHTADRSLAADNCLTTADFIARAGLGWKVRLEPLHLADGRQVRAAAVVRDTDNAVLGDHVGPQWTPLQNADAFRWFDPFVESGSARLETAGSLNGGRRVWVLAELNRRPLTVAPGDQVRKFLLLSNSHDGSLAVRAGFTPIRVVCHNTLSAAHANGGNLLRIRHTRSVGDTLSAARAVIERVDAEFEKVGDTYRELASRPVKSAAQLREYIRTTFGLTEDAKRPGQLCTRSQNTLDAIMRRYEDGRAAVAELLAADRQHNEIQAAAQHTVGASLLDSIIGNFEAGRGVADAAPVAAGSWWTAYNAVTEYLTHQRGKDAENRLSSLWYGNGAQINAAALDNALAASAV